MRFRTRFFLSVCAALAVLFTPALLFAHARLLRSWPAALARIAEPPTALRLWFSERPELRFSSIELVDSTGTVIPVGALASADSMSITASIAKPLTPGRYSVAWRTAAADGHFTSGRFTFAIVSPSDSVLASVPSAPRDTSRPASSSESNAPIEPGGPSGYSLSIRWAELVAALALIGAVVFRLFVLPGADWPVHELTDAADRVRRFAISVVVLFIVTSFVRLVAQAELMPPMASSGSAVMSTMRDTAWGRGWMFAAAGAGITLVVLFLARAGRGPWVGAGIGAVAICVGEAMTGHSVAMGRHIPLAVATDVAHFLSAGGWLGGLTCVVLCGFPAMRSLDADRRAFAGARLVRSYHRAAIECVTLTLLTALIAAWLRLEALSDLWTTPYGLALVRKLIVVLIVLGFGLYHWRTAVARDWTPNTASRFRLSATGELIAGAIVVALTTILVSTGLPNTP